MSDEDKIDKFGKSFIKLTEMSVDIIAQCITKIETPDGEVTDLNIIKDFINNCSKDIFDKIASHVSLLRDQIEFKSHVHCADCSHEYDLPVAMDQSNFFAVRS
jgi:hypothetical protein